MLQGGKSNHFGIEAVSGLRWQGWEPGQEYTKNITLKNVRVKTQKLKFKGPNSRFFTTLYPQPIVLSAGTSFTLPVTFRPLEKTLYADQVEFLTNEGRFAIAVEATLPQFEVEVAELVPFPLCAAHDQVQATFELCNVSELVTDFTVECDPPFTVEPAESVLEPFSKVTLTATFKPKGAIVYETFAVIKYGKDLAFSKLTKFEGIGKYPHLLVKSSCVPTSSFSAGSTETLINFGTLSVGSSAEKWIELHNLAPVNAPFSVEQPLGPCRIDKVFSCTQNEGVVPANGNIRIPLFYSPNIVGTKSIDYFHIKAIGNISKTVVKCVGACKGPLVHLSRDLINFYQIDSGKQAIKTVDIINTSDTDATFQFVIDCSESVFKFEHVSGILPANSTKTVVLQFEPLIPINYYRHITCLVHNQDPLKLDLLGTCHTETVKPAVLQAKHVWHYHSHALRGLSFIPPEQLNQMMRDEELQLDENGALYRKTGTDDVKLPPNIPAMEEFFNDGYYSDVTHQPPHVSSDIFQASFGRCSDMRSIEQKTVNLTNHTTGKITVVWTGGPSHVFSVSPDTMDIPPLKSCAFCITFKPNAPNQFYGAELECYAYYKSMRDYRLTEDTTHCPPWCLTLVATGDTFMAKHETFLPRFMLDSNRVVFPAVNAHESAYRTVLLSNTGTTPILYDFQKDNTGIYSVKPTKGLLPPSQHQVFVMKILPRDVKNYRYILKLTLNTAEKHTQDILASGSAESAQVLLDHNGEMYFKPTCIGTNSCRQYAVHNSSRIPLIFEWKMKHADAKLLEVIPSSGLIMPNEKQFHTWLFKPQHEEKSVMKPALIVWGRGLSASSSAGKKQQFTIRAIGQGCVGQIKAEQNYIDFGTVIVGSSGTRYVTLMNDSNCSLHYSLSLQQSIDGPYPEQQTQYDSMALELESMEGVLPARSRHTIQVTVRPTRRVCYQWSISYRLITPQGMYSHPEPQHLCHLLATGVYPTLAVSDARCYGSSASLSKTQLWHLFSLDQLNSSLDADPSPSELVYSVATRQSHHRRPPVMTRVILDFNFSAAPLHSEACTVQLVYENTGSVTCDWAFLFPRDLQLELDYWAETGQFDEDELHEMKVMDNKLFTVEPKSGRLEPGETVTISFIYHHVMAGTSRLPVLLKLTRGREILLNFIGVTVEPDRHYIHFSSNQHQFTPIPIGQQNPPKQIYEMYNGGACPVRYHMDVEPLKQLQEENFDHPIFEVLNPAGEVRSGHTSSIEWIFSPLEAKTYSADIPMVMEGGHTAIITFTGIGYDKRMMGETMPITDHHIICNVPSVQTAPVPGQLCYLSEERVSFGNLPLYNKACCLATLTNRSMEHVLAFTWHVTVSQHKQFVTVTPSVGRLEPGEGQMCKVTFISSGQPSFCDVDLVCEINNLTDYEQYQQEVEAWDAEQARKQVEFCITEDDPLADTKISDAEDRPSSRLKSLENISLTPSPDADLAKYKTLPPIKQITMEEQRHHEKARRKFDRKYWGRPQPPKPFLLHLGVTARTHDIIEFQQNFPEDYKNFYVDRSLSEGHQSGVTSDFKQVPCVQAEADVVAGTLTTILRSLLDDIQLQDSFTKVMEEPTPYFQQFTSCPPACRTHDTVASAVKRLGSEIHTHTPVASSAHDHITSNTPSSIQPTLAGAVDYCGETADTSDMMHAVDRVSGTLDQRSSLMQSQYDESQARSLSSARDSRKTSAASATGSTSRSSTAYVQHQKSNSGNQEQEQAFYQKQSLKKLPEFGTLAECLIENTLTNVIQEAASQEFNITARSRLVALPPKPTSAASSTSRR